MVGTRVTDAEFDLIRRAADGDHRTVADWIRLRVLEAARQELGDAKDRPKRA